MKLSRFRMNPSNPRTIRRDRFEKLCKSIEEFPKMMALRPIVYDPENMWPLGGNMRLKALKKLGYKDAPDEWFKSADDLTEEEKKRFVIADNVAFGEWDMDSLANEWDTMNLLDWGLEIPSLEAADAEGPTDAEPQIDRAAVLNKKWKVKYGDLWQIGEHRLLCGDSTKEKTRKYITAIFDPEWNENIVGVNGENVLAFCDAQSFGNVIENYGVPTWVFAWDCVTSWYTPNRPLKRGKYCLWYGDITKYNSDGAHYGDSGEERVVSNTRGSYTFKPDARGKHLSDVYNNAITKLHHDSEHNHSKPLDWVRMLIGNCTQGDVYDPFLGSGTTMVACENLKRKCIGIEIDPGYCAVVLQRMFDAFPGIEIKRVKK